MQQSPTGKEHTAASLTETYPYCATYWIQYCKALADAEAPELQEVVRRAAVGIPDRMKLFSALNQENADWIVLMRDIEEKRRQEELQREAEDNSLDLIDSFITGGSKNTVPAKVASSYSLGELEDLPEREQDEQDSLIDNFLEAEQNGALFVPETIDNGQWAASSDLALDKVKERAILTESLAKVYVRQGKYQQALTIFRNLNEKYSEQYSYFADQIRFLERAIELLDQNKNQENNKQK